MTPSTGGFLIPINRTAAVGVPQQFYLFDELAGREPLTIDAAIHDAVMAQGARRRVQN
jgi:hypothetical protein